MPFTAPTSCISDEQQPLARSLDLSQIAWRAAGQTGETGDQATMPRIRHINRRQSPADAAAQLVGMTDRSITVCPHEITAGADSVRGGIGRAGEIERGQNAIDPHV